MLPGELLVSITLPTPFPDHAAFFKVAKRSLDDISTLAAAYSLTLDAAGCIASARIAYGGAAATPLRVPAAERVLLGSPWNHAAVRRAQQAVAGALKPLSDHRGSAAYRLAVAQTLLAKFWDQTAAGEAA